MVKPLGSRVLVKPAPKIEKKLESGLLVDENSIKAPASLKLTVVAKGPDCQNEDIQVGRDVLVAQWAPTEAQEWPGERTLMVTEEDVLAVIVPDQLK